MKVATSRVQFPKQMGKIHQPFRHQVPDIVRTLPLTIHPQQARTHHFTTLLLQKARPDDDVHVSCFVFDRQEHDALRSLRALPHGYQAAATRETRIVIQIQNFRWHKAHRVQSLT